MYAWEHCKATCAHKHAHWATVWDIPHCMHYICLRTQGLSVFANALYLYKGSCVSTPLHVYRDRGPELCLRMYVTYPTLHCHQGPVARLECITRIDKDLGSYSGLVLRFFLFPSLLNCQLQHLPYSTLSTPPSVRPWLVTTPWRALPWPRLWTQVACSLS